MKQVTICRNLSSIISILTVCSIVMVEKCDISIPDAKYHNDILHPCIRYIPNGFCGHNWWLIASPYYNYDDSIENPILFFGDSNNSDTPPLKWHFYDVVEDSPTAGYNSDPNICFNNGELLAIWRKYQTPDIISKGFNSALFLRKYSEQLGQSKAIFILGETQKFNFSDLSPILIAENGTYDLYTINFHFSNSIVKRTISFLLRRLNIGYCAHKTIGLNHYSGKSLSNIKLTETIPINGKGGADNPWHFDIITYQDQTYLLLYCRRLRNIYLAHYKNNCFHIVETPLLQPSSIKDTYKPTGIVIGDILWLYYSDKTDKQNCLFREQINLREFLSCNNVGDI